MNRDILLDICLPMIEFFPDGHKILSEGSVSENFDLGLSFAFNVKKRETVCEVLKLNFLDYIKYKLRHKSKF